MTDENEHTNPTFSVMVSNIQCPNRRWDNLCYHKDNLIGEEQAVGKHCNADICPIIHDMGEP